jgi:hypothetical protein
LRLAATDAFTGLDFELALRFPGLARLEPALVAFVAFRLDLLTDMIDLLCVIGTIRRRH